MGMLEKGDKKREMNGMRKKNVVKEENKKKIRMKCDG